MSAVANENAAGTGVLSWQHALARAVREAAVDVVAYVPDGRLHGVVVSLEERGQLVRTLTREDECVAYAAGFGAAGGRAAVLMQCSGLGNALNALASFPIPYGIGIPLVLSMRGTLGERNPSQVPMGRATLGLLGSLAIQAFPVAAPEAVAPAAAGVFELAYSTGSVAALLLEPALGGTDKRR